MRTDLLEYQRDFYNNARAESKKRVNSRATWSEMKKDATSSK
jgi:hypothetical protein